MKIQQSKLQVPINIKASYFSFPNAPTKTVSYLNDSVEISTKRKEKIKKNLFVAGGIAVLGMALFMKGRFSHVKNLVEYIDFKPSKTIGEAKAFAKENFGIRKFKVDDIEVANYLNNAFACAVNITKGKIKLPDIVKVESISDAAAAVTGRLFSKEKVMYYDPSEIPTYAYFEREYLPTLKKICKGDIVNRFINAFKGDFTERVEAYEILCKTFGLQSYASPFNVVFHELGHLMHEKQSKDIYKRCLSNSSFLGDSKEIFIARKVSEYAATNSLEFVAEVYANLLSGKTYTKEIMDMYVKYGGPKI